MAAYGLYSHIQSNRRRSIALLVGLFFLIFSLSMPARFWRRRCR
jgi:heat shock protein HtpX